MNNKLKQHFQETLNWIKYDYTIWPVRFFLEVLAWVGSVGTALIMAVTVPNPPLILLYPIWIISCSIYAWSAYTRKSFGMLMNYILLISIDITAFYRLLN